MDNKRIRELIDTCRPGGMDLADTEMQELSQVLSTDADMRKLYEQAQANDDAIRAKLHQVDVPDDLTNRLMARLARDLDLAQSNVRANLENDTQVQMTSESAADEFNSFRSWARRRWLVTAVLASAAAIGGLLLAPSLLTSRMKAGELSLKALDWIDALDKSWNVDLSTSPEHAPFSEHLSALPNGWQSWLTPSPLSESSTAYRLSPFFRGKAAVLFVAQGPNRVRDLTTTPPKEPLADTAGRASSVWREQDRLYVLVVPGGRRQYQSCLRNQQLAAILMAEP